MVYYYSTFTFKSCTIQMFPHGTDVNSYLYTLILNNSWEDVSYQCTKWLTPFPSILWLHHMPCTCSVPLPVLCFSYLTPLCKFSVVCVSLLVLVMCGLLCLTCIACNVPCFMTLDQSSWFLFPLSSVISFNKSPALAFISSIWQRAVKKEKIIIG